MIKSNKLSLEENDGYLVPIPTDKDAASGNILKVINCWCKSTSKNQCETHLWSCKKNGLKCMPSYGECHGEDCNNKEVNKLPILIGNGMNSVLCYIISLR